MFKKLFSKCIKIIRGNLISFYLKILLSLRSINLKLVYRIWFIGINEAHPIYNIFYPRIIQNYLVQIKDQIIFCDIGANNGYISNVLLKKIPKLHVIAFEPLQSKKTIFKEMERKYDNFIYKDLALGDKIEEQEFFEYSNDAHSSFIPVDIENNTLGLKLTNKYKIKVSTLDHETGSINKKLFLKIDSQGYEKKILDGCANLFEKNLIVGVIIELQIRNIENQQDFTDFLELSNFFKSKDFFLSDIQNGYRTNGVLQEFDALFLPKSEIDKITNKKNDGKLYIFPES